uniref:Putative evasin n=1 Tax=Rhipicephalus microplus TaxID=6941 RepID=A0A6G5A5B2_RHIMP
MALFKALRNLLFLLVTFEAIRARTNALVSNIVAGTNGGDPYNIRVLFCNKTCISGRNDCPEGCFCTLIGHANTGYCYNITGDFPDKEPDWYLR